MPINADNRPTDYEYAILSQQAYNVNLKKDSSIDVLPDWKVKLVRRGAMDFRVVIFENAETKQWVVSYKGTNSVKSLLEDVIGVVRSGDSPQKAEAFKIVKQLVQGQLVLPAGYQLSFTGHSLGAFLALMSLYYAHTLKADWPSLHAVVFECPGMAASFEAIKSHGGVINPNLLDIIAYISYPNVINTFDNHIGETLYSAPVDLGAWGNWSGWYTKKSHSIDGFVDYLNPNHVQEHPLHCLSDWPINGASIVGGERGVYFEQARFDEENGHYVLDLEEESLNSSAPDKLYDKTRALLFDGHYHILAEDVFNPTRGLRLRHFSPGFQDFLGKFHGMRGLLLSSPEIREVFKRRAQTLGVPDSIVELLLSYELKQDVDAQWFLILSAEMAVTSYQFRKELSNWLANGGEAKISQLIISLAQGEEAIKDDRIKVVAEVIAKGAEVHGIVLCNTVEGIGIYLTNTADEKEKENAKDLLTHLKSVTREIEAYVVAPGAIVSESAIIYGNYVGGAVIHSGTAQPQAFSQIDIDKLLSERMARCGVADSRSSSSSSSSSGAVTPSSGNLVLGEDEGKKQQEQAYRPGGTLTSSSSAALLLAGTTVAAGSNISSNTVTCNTTYILSPNTKMDIYICNSQIPAIEQNSLPELLPSSEHSRGEERRARRDPYGVLPSDNPLNTSKQQSKGKEKEKEEKALLKKSAYS